MKFISPDSIDDIIWEDSYTLTDTNTEIYTDLSATLTDEYNNSNIYSIMENDRPAYFTVGFLTDLEGCYQNILGIFLLDKTTNEKYLL